MIHPAIHDTANDTANNAATHNAARRRARHTKLALIATLGLALLVPAGCAIFGVVASVVPPPPVKPKHVLAGQKVGVMVWCDRGLRIDWPTVQRDLAGGVQTRLGEAVKAKAKEMEGVTFPYPPESFVKWQRDHPGYDAQPITEIAPRLPVTRLIYIELTDLSTRSSKAMALYRGTANASIKVIDVPAGATAGTIVYQESEIRVVYPKHSTEDGRPEGDDMRMYAGTITELADKLTLRFIEHDPEAEE